MRRKVKEKRINKSGQLGIALMPCDSRVGTSKSMCPSIDSCQLNSEMLNAVSCHALSSHAISYDVRTRPAMPYHAMPCHVTCCATRYVDVT